MNTRSLNRRGTLQQLNAGEDALGQPVTTWVDVAAVWADVRQISGLEAIRANASVTENKASIRIRYRPGVVASMRIIVDGVIYTINAVLPDVAHRRHMDLVCVVNG